MSFSEGGAELLEPGLRRVEGTQATLYQRLEVNVQVASGSWVDQ